VRAYKTLDFLLPNADIELLEKASNRVFERLWGKTAPEMMKMHHQEAEEFAQEFGELLYEMPFQVPENLILLGRCLGILSGMCSGLNPEFNIWTELSPYVGKLVESEKNGKWQFWLDEIGTIVTSLAALPRKTETLLNRVEQGRLEVQTPNLNRQIKELHSDVRRIPAAIVFAAFLLAGVYIEVNQPGIMGEILIGIAGLSFLVTLFTH
jgi:predicted unusual protein kinase regulating ubiquinone biosynthesis (AarF/ABC1/UbiB family)